MLAGVEIIVVTVAVISLGFAVPISYCAGVLSDVVVGALIDMVVDVIMDVVTGIGVEVLADANVNVFASMMTALEFAVPKPREGFNC